MSLEAKLSYDIIYYLLFYTQNRTNLIRRYLLETTRPYGDKDEMDTGRVYRCKTVVANIVARLREIILTHFVKSLTISNPANST
jgi:hypothetical protein